MGENGKNVSKSVENTAGKGENARYEQFLHFLQTYFVDKKRKKKKKTCSGKG